MIEQQQYSRLKAALTRAIHSGKPEKIIATVRAARLIFNETGYPDHWPLWRVAVDDLIFAKDDKISEAARVESALWS